jgi:acyl-CoA synthetase (AMP-forming)/AMP-acid ligase II
VQGCAQLELGELRDALRGKLSNYKLPTVLRVVKELKKTASLKVPKTLLKGELFEAGHADVQRWGTRGPKL